MGGTSPEVALGREIVRVSKRGASGEGITGLLACRGELMPSRVRLAGLGEPTTQRETGEGSQELEGGRAAPAGSGPLEAGVVPEEERVQEPEETAGSVAGHLARVDGR